MIKNTVFNQVALNGNKFKSEKLVYKSIKKIQKTNKKKSFKDLFKTSIINSSPVFYLKNIKRKRKKNVEFPFMLSKNLRVSYSLKFILYYCKNIKSSALYLKLNNELVQSSKRDSQSVKHIEKLYKDAFIKKKFASYRWF